jgi:hypothetical protein
VTTGRRQVSFRLDPDVYASLQELAGPVPLAHYVEGLIKRVVRGQGMPEREPTLPMSLGKLPVRAPQQVEVVGLEKLEAPIGEVAAMVREVLRAVVEHREYELLRDAEIERQGGALRQWRRPVPEVSRKAVEMAARDAAARYLASRFPERKPNGSG